MPGSCYDTYIEPFNIKLLDSREKLHGFEYPPDEQIMIRPLVANIKPSPENIFPFEGKEKI